MFITRLSILMHHQLPASLEAFQSIKCPKVANDRHYFGEIRPGRRSGMARRKVNLVPE